jgi:hypothetical protein
MDPVSAVEPGRRGWIAVGEASPDGAQADAHGTRGSTVSPEPGLSGKPG